MKWLTWLPRFVGFLLWFAQEVTVSSAVVARDVFTPEHKSSPVVVRLPTRCRSEFETALLSVLISLTPGTLVLATAAPGGAPRADHPGRGRHEHPEDRPARAGHARRAGRRAHAGSGSMGYELYVHCMYQDGPDAARRALRRTETRMLDGIRAEGAPR